MTIEFGRIGWCRDPVENHDKVWGVIVLQKADPTEFKYNYDRNFGDYSFAKCLVFWGRRGKKLQTKVSIDDYDMNRLLHSKEKKGYQWVDKNKLDTVYPEFEEDLKKTAFWATFKI